MSECSKCKKKIGFFSTAVTCSEADCSKVYCEDCAKTEIKVCKDCNTDYHYCTKHIENHEHEADNEEDEEEEDEESSEQSSELECCNVSKSKSGNTVLITTNGNGLDDQSTADELVELLEDAFDKNYVIIKELSDGNNIFMRK
jgi:hypothetical protein